jgi:hypothetical protein
LLLDKKKEKKATHTPTHKKQAFNEPNNKVFFFNGSTFDELLKTATPTIAKINTNTQKNSHFQ